MRAYFREHDWVARFAEDTIAVLLPETTPADAISLAERTRTMIEDRLTFRDYRTERRIVVTVSVAVASARALEGEPIDHAKCVAAAEAALARAKTGGRNRVEHVELLPRLISIEEATKVLRTTVEGVEQLVSSGALDPVNSGRYVRLERAAVEALARRRISAPSHRTPRCSASRNRTRDRPTATAGGVRICCMARILIAATLLAVAQATHPGTPFNPWGDEGYRTVNAIEFAPDGQTMFVALETARVAKIEGRVAAPDAPEIALYESRREGDRWSRPQLLPFAGRFKDYEAALSPDGQWMLFNSWRPLPDGREITNRKNNLWLTRRTPQGWSTPEYLAGINRFETEESYRGHCAGWSDRVPSVKARRTRTAPTGTSIRRVSRETPPRRPRRLPRGDHGRRKRPVVCEGRQLCDLHEMGSRPRVGNRRRPLPHLPPRYVVDTGDSADRNQRSCRARLRGVDRRLTRADLLEAARRHHGRRLASAAGVGARPRDGGRAVLAERRAKLYDAPGDSNPAWRSRLHPGDADNRMAIAMLAAYHYHRRSGAVRSQRPIGDRQQPVAHDPDTVSRSR